MFWQTYWRALEIFATAILPHLLAVVTIFGGIFILLLLFFALVSFFKDHKKS